MKRTNVEIGSKINLLTIVEDLGVINRNLKVIATCECGVTKEYFYTSIKTGNTQSCGCIKKERILEATAKHLLSKHKIHKLWVGMRGRCYREKNTNYRNYGGRGVTVCEEWRNDFMNFYEWAIANGWQEGLHLDKDKLAPTQVGNHYCPEFCCFLSQLENSRNTSLCRMVTYRNQTQNLSAWCEELGLPYYRMQRRLKQLKWSSEKTFETPIKKYRS